MTLARMVGAIHGRAWKRLGSPTMTVIKPVATWSLPAGYAYDDDTDTIRSGTTALTVAQAENYWNTTTVNIVTQGLEPGPQQPAQVQTTDDQQTVYVWILPADVAIVRAAWAVKLGDHLYNVIEVLTLPASGGAGHRARLDRRRENRTAWAGWDQAWRPR